MNILLRLGFKYMLEYVDFKVFLLGLLLVCLLSLDFIVWIQIYFPFVSLKQFSIIGYY